MTQLGFSDLLELLGHDEFVAVCTRPIGGQFRSTVVPYRLAESAVPATGDCWYSANPLSDPATWPPDRGRGTSAEVVRLAVLFADLDVKSSGLPTFEVAWSVVDALSVMLGTRPVAVVMSGGGLQPLWTIEDGPAGPDARVLLRRFGRLVVHTAERHGGSADMVYDVARVLRTPGTLNHKYTPPVPVIGVSDTGRPLSIDELDERLTEYGVVELPGDREEAGAAQLSDPAGWGWAPQTCTYARSMVAYWSSDEPAARHPWLVRQATRIAAAHRYGCFDADGYTAAVNRLQAVFHGMLARGTEARKEAPGEIADAFAWGRDLAGSKTDAQIASELGGHSHDHDEPLSFDRSSVPPNFPLGSAFSNGAEEATGAAEAAGRDVADDPWEVVRQTFKRLDWFALWEDESGEDWILEPLIAARRGVALFSPPKVGKSLLALEIAVGISRGTRTLGAMPDRAHRLLYVDHENDPVGDVRTRLEDMGYGPEDLDNLFYLSYPKMAPLDTRHGAEELVAVAQAYDCDIVVIDTISRAVAGEENDNNTWLSLYRLTGLALKQAGIAVLRLDHTGKDQEKGMRGGSAKYGDLDAVWKLTKEAEDTYKLTCTDKRMRLTETELVVTREIDPLRHKVEGGGWMAAADARFNELVSRLAELNVPKDAGRNVARAALKTAGVKATNSDLENAIRHRKTCPNWARAGVDHKTCPKLIWAGPGSEAESAV